MHNPAREVATRDRLSEIYTEGNQENVPNWWQHLTEAFISHHCQRNGTLSRIPIFMSIQLI